MRIGEDGEYILNGNFMVMHRKVIVHPGVTIEYSGPESVVERLNSSRPIVIDLILEAGLKNLHLELHYSTDNNLFKDMTLKRKCDILGVIRRERVSATNYVRVHCTEKDSKQLYVVAQQLVNLQSNVPGYEIS